MAHSVVFGKIICMTYDQQFQVVVDLPLDTEQTVYNDGELEIYLFRPSQLKKKYEGYDPYKNFQVWLRGEGVKPFKPNHLRVMIDLHLRLLSRPDLKQQLAQAMDDIFFGADPEDAIAALKHEHFEHYLNSLDVTAQLAQLFLIEQAYGYNKESNYDPGTLFFQGQVRQVIDGKRDIDNVLVSIARGQAPPVAYTYQDDKKHKKRIAQPEPLWWLSN